MDAVRRLLARVLPSQHSSGPDHTETLASLRARNVELNGQLESIGRDRRRMEERYDALVGAAADAVIVIDDRGIVRTFNPSAEQIFGYLAAEVLGQNVSMLMPEPHRAAHDGYLEHYHRTGEARIIGVGREVLGRRKDGSTVPLDLSITDSRTEEGRFFTGVMRDMTERKRAEAEVRDNADRMRAVVETAVEGILTIDEQGIIIEANPAVERLFGHAREAVLGHNIAMLMPEPYRSAHDGYLDRYRTTGERRIIGIGREVTGLRKDGSTFPLDLSVGEFQAAGRRFFTGIVRDITTRKAAEAGLRASEERFRLLVDGVPDYAIYMLDAAGHVASWNSGAERLMGWRADEIIGQSAAVLHRPAGPGSAAAELDAQLRTVRERGVRRSEGTGLRKDGTGFVLEMTTTALHDEAGQLVGYARVARDVTERKRAEMELRASEAQHRAVVDTAVDAIVVIDHRGTIAAFNQAAERIFGYTAQEAMGQNVRLLMPEPHHAAHDGYLERYRKTGERRIIGIGREVAGRRKDGSVFPLDLSIAEWRDSGGRPFFTGIMRDITARKDAEERQRLLMAELDHRVKNTLAVVQSIAQQSLGRADDRVQAFFSRLRALARAHELLARNRWTGASLKAIALETLEPYRGGDAQRLRIEGPDALLSARAAQTLSLALQELATNAAKYGALSAADGRLHLHWHGERRDDEARLRMEWIETNGPRVTPPARRGFGMSLVETTIRYELNGSVRLDFKPDGLHAAFDLPYAGTLSGDQPPVVELAPSLVSVAAAGALAGRRILLVEDELLIAANMEEILREAECQVVGPTPRLAEAIEMAEREDLDGAVLDVNLQGEMVWPAAEVLRRRGIPYLFATGYGSGSAPPPPSLAAPRLGKPVVGRELVAALEAALRERNSAPKLH